MNDYVDTPRGYLGHVGSVTVVTHNVLTSGLLPKNMGWSDDGYRDTTGLLPGTNPFWIPSSWSRQDMFTVQESIGKRRLPDYLKAADPTAKTFAVSPKGYAAWAFGGPTADSIITFGSNTSCGDTNRRGPSGVNVPAYIAQPCGATREALAHRAAVGAGRDRGRTPHRRPCRRGTRGRVGHRQQRGPG
jgi:hypothetical protein